MLIEFSVANFRSFWKTQTLKLTATTQTELLEQNTFVAPVPGIPRLLRSAVIYGPNAGGKSNFIEAVQLTKALVLSSAKEGQEGEAIRVQPFLFNKEGKGKPSEFEAIFIQDGVRYQYGFAATSDAVTNEWLLAYPEGRAQRWFERTVDEETQEQSWYFGSKFTGPRKLWREATRRNALFLSTAIQLNNEQLKPVFRWFQKLEIIGHDVRLDPVFSIKQCQDDVKREEILKFMNAADLSIADIKLEAGEFSADNLPADMPRSLKDKVRKDFEGKKMLMLKFLHPIGESNEMADLPIEEESDGTRKLFAYAGPWLDILANGRVIFVDELDNSLHSKIVLYLLKLLHNTKTNRKNGQLVFTSHDTSILDQQSLRRDQIWFVEKDRWNATNLYPLSDFSPRKGDALEKGYLRGRYGALPYVTGMSV